LASDAQIATQKYNKYEEPRQQESSNVNNSTIIDSNYSEVGSISIKNSKGLVPVAHACNPSYSGGRDQEA
jgi:hypothetical protein